MENYSLLMGAAALMKMAVEMAAVSMKKPSGGTSPLRRVRNETLSPDLGQRWRRLWNFSRTVASSSYFCKLPEDRRDNEVGPRGDQRGGRRGPSPGRADLPPGPLVWPPALTLRLLKASVAKPPESHDTENLRDAPPNPISGDSGDRLRHPAGEGIHLPEDSTPPWSPPE
ncbi:hypothetical protein QYE76_041186 [Lolium multiflorum]|uniref:Uncharacterized protein n=1 Tax=Lolium multiflorum TaxID=4521 RepID=A0AAD8TE88_LOLMU|nr:hypothetical protein QYE76_041186 [Lolium multiflorum]